MEPLVLSVSDCVAYINQTLEYAYPSITVEGEVGSFKVSKDKYVFFDIKDDQASLGCFMMIYNLRMPIEDGMRAKVIAEPRLTAWGRFSLTVRQIVPSGEGDIKRSFELLKRKLASEGLFDAERKRLLPEKPERIGVISSVEAAGYKDFTTILNSRWGGIELAVANVQVQGIAAGEQIIRAIHHFNEQADPPEVLVIVRGGGSADDLAVFNDEVLVRAIAGSRVPTLVGVGHEVDTSLADLAADVRAATPTNAAQLLVPDKREVIAEVDHIERRLLDEVGRRCKNTIERVDMTGDQLLQRIYHRQTDLEKHLRYSESILVQLNPRTVLRRGYALVRDASGKLIHGQGVKPDDEVRIELERVIIEAGVKNVSKK